MHKNIINRQKVTTIFGGRSNPNNKYWIIYIINFIYNNVKLPLIMYIYIK